MHEVAVYGNFGTLTTIASLILARRAVRASATNVDHFGSGCVRARGASTLPEKGGRLDGG
jgi:hypothetical protein